MMMIVIHRSLSCSHLDGPALEYEQLRRKIEFQARELTYFTNDQMRKIAEKLSDDDKVKWNNVMDRVADQNRFVTQQFVFVSLPIDGW